MRPTHFGPNVCRLERSLRALGRDSDAQAVARTTPRTHRVFAPVFRRGSFLPRSRIDDRHGFALARRGRVCVADVERRARGADRRRLFPLRGNADQPHDYRRHGDRKPGHDSRLARFRLDACWASIQHAGIPGTPNSDRIADCTYPTCPSMRCSKAWPTGERWPWSVSRPVRRSWRI